MFLSRILSLFSIMLFVEGAVINNDQFKNITGAFYDCLGTDAGRANMTLYSDGGIVISPSTNRSFDFCDDLKVWRCFFKIQDGKQISLDRSNWVDEANVHVVTGDHVVGLYGESAYVAEHRKRNNVFHYESSSTNSRWIQRKKKSQQLST